MNALVVITDQKAVTTSRIIAEAFEKQHKNVLRDIEKIECSEEFGRLNFEPSSYLNDQNKQQPMYNITRDGFVFLAMGFTGKKAAEFKEKFITAFNTMERALIEGQGEHRRIDVNMRHQRGITNPHGLDIAFRLDLTKLVMKPTREGLAVLERLTGVPMDGILADVAISEDTPFGEAFASFYELCCQTAPATERLLYAGVYAAFVRHVGTFPEPVFISRRRFSRAMQAAGHAVIHLGGQAYITALSLMEEGGVR